VTSPAERQEVCAFCGASSARVGLMQDHDLYDEGVWRCINEYNCSEREARLLRGESGGKE